MSTATKKQYTEAIGRRKTATARVRLSAASKASYMINDQDLATYFPTAELQKIITDPFAVSKKAYAVSVHVKGSGIHSQAEAVRHGISRALVIEDEADKTTLKQEGFLKRDPRS